MIAQTERLILREFELSDTEPLGAVFGDAEVMQYSNIGVRDAEGVRQWLREWIEVRYPAWGFGMWAVVEKNRGEVLGYCGLTRFEDRCVQGETEMGYRLARAHWGRGYATEAAGAVRDYGLNVLGLLKIVASIDPSNAASIRVAEKIGMRYEREMMLEGWTHPDRVYAISR